MTNRRLLNVIMMANGLFVNNVLNSGYDSASVLQRIIAHFLLLVNINTGTFLILFLNIPSSNALNVTLEGTARFEFLKDLPICTN